MNARGLDFLEDWIAKNVTAGTRRADAKIMAKRCLSDATALGIRHEDMEWNVEKTILEAIEHINEPGTPSD